MCVFCHKIGFRLLVFFLSPVRLVVYTNDRIFFISLLFPFHESIFQCPTRKFVVVIPRPRMVVESISSTHTQREECVSVVALLAQFTEWIIYVVVCVRCIDFSVSELSLVVINLISHVFLLHPLRLLYLYFLFCIFVRTSPSMSGLVCMRISLLFSHRRSFGNI